MPARAPASRGCKQLRMEFEDFRETVIETPERMAVLAELIERARRDPVIGAIMQPMYGFWRIQMREILGLGIADGSFRPDIDPSLAPLIAGWRSFRLALQGRIRPPWMPFLPNSSAPSCSINHPKDRLNVIATFHVP